MAAAAAAGVERSRYGIHMGESYRDVTHWRSITITFYHERVQEIFNLKCIILFRGIENYF